jgi:hypothetical protein
VRKVLAFFLLSQGLVLTSSCTVLESSQDFTEQGIVYYLPKTVLDIYVKPNPVMTSTDPTKPAPDAALTPFYVGSQFLGMSITPTTIPDLSQKYLLKYNSNVFYNDRVCVSTTSNGMLSSVEMATEDATPQIAVDLAALVSTVTPGIGQAFAARAAGRARELQPVPVRVTIDPTNDDDIRAANNLISSNLLLQGVMLDVGSLKPPPNEPPADCTHKGVCFRTLVKAPLRLTKGSTQVSPTVYVDAVSQAHLGHMDLERAFLIENLVGLGFQNGALTQVILRKPSQALQAVRLPLGVADAILAVPGNLLGRASGGTAALNAVNTEATNRGAVESSVQTRLTAIETMLSTRPAGVTEGTVFQVRCSGSLTTPVTAAATNAPKTSN